jgi:CHAD domain-containing protein
MRIAGKPLRYLMESLEGSYGKEFKRSLRELEETLDLLGSIHDCDVAIATLTQYREELSIANARGGEKAAGVPSRPVTGLLLSQQAARNRLMRQLHRTLRLRESS